ncbi:MAG TPA: hypothetical protein VHB27_01600 [Rhodopila sp.]|uniref:hypothetical protein n=1 Tax=Rhodopila sp. TaxID=2480087 RepID=UPI002B6C6F38|nr:hypothetical protein [Rhodopila sp.]HVY13893.1 hypothetical protein [Rhodopila sp.]
MPDDTSFVWPAAGAIQVTSLPSGGCNIKITFADKGVVRSIGKGRVVKAKCVPSKRIAQQYDITVRHGNDFESSYSIVDQTPHSAAEIASQLNALGPYVESGGELYNISNGGFLHFQLFRAGKLVDPREYIKAPQDGPVETPEPQA